MRQPVVYILASATGRALYIGITTDLGRRLSMELRLSGRCGAVCADATFQKSLFQRNLATSGGNREPAFRSA